MSVIRIIGDFSGFLGFILLFNKKEFVELYLFLRKKIDLYGEPDLMWPKNRILSIWEHKYKSPIALIFLSLSALISLVDSILKF